MRNKYVDPLSLVETCAGLSAGSLNAQAQISRRWQIARQLEPQLQAFAFLPDAPPVAGQGPLAGIAVGIKDLMDTGDMPTSYGSAIYRHHLPKEDAWIVSRLRSLGASVLGKTVTTEFAWRRAGPTRNPWNLGHTPGGSSSGSAAAVAAGIVPLALGTQTFGSIVRPAAFCGIVGFKPTFGSFSRQGVHPLSVSLDHVGLFTRCVADMAWAFQLLAPSGVAVPSAEKRPPHLAALALADGPAQPAQIAAFDAALAKLAAAGTSIEFIEAPTGFSDLQALADVLVAFEANQIFAPLLERHPGGLGEDLQKLVTHGKLIELAAYESARAHQKTLAPAFAARLAGFDGLLTLPATGEAPRGLTSTGDAQFCVPWSVMGVPAITLPVATGPGGLPLGLQIVGRWGNDHALLESAAFCENVLQAPSFAHSSQSPLWGGIKF